MKGIIITIATVGQVIVSNPLFVHNSTNVHAMDVTQEITRQLTISKPPLINNITHTYVSVLNAF